MNIESTYVVMDRNGAATAVDVTESFFEDLDKQFGDFAGMTLISRFLFDMDWPTWELHPHGDEFVCLLSGSTEMHLKKDGVESMVRLATPGSFIIVPKGTWHTAKVAEPTAMMFVTPGQDTQNIPLNEFKQG